MEGLRCSCSSGGQGPAQYLGSSHHCRRGCHIQASLPEVHKGIVTSVFCLNQAIINFLSKEKQKHTELEGSDRSLFFLLSPEGWHVTLPSHWFSLGLKSEALWVGGGKTDIGSTWEWKIEFWKNSSLLTREGFSLSSTLGLFLKSSSFLERLQGFLNVDSSVILHTATLQDTEETCGAENSKNWLCNLRPATNWLSDLDKYPASTHTSVFWKMRTVIAPNWWSTVRVTWGHSTKASDTVAGFNKWEP